MTGIFGLLLQDRRHRLYWGSFGKLRQPEDAAAEVNLHDGAGLGGIHQDVIFHRRGGGAKETAVLFSLRHLLFNTWDGSVISGSMGGCFIGSWSIPSAWKNQPNLSNGSYHADAVAKSSPQGWHST